MSKGKDQKNLPSQKPADNKSLKSSEVSDFQNKKIKQKWWYSLKEASSLLGGISEKDIIEYAFNGELFIYIPTPSGIHSLLGETDLCLYHKNFEESVKFHKLVGAYTYYLSSIEEAHIEESEHYNQFGAGLFDKELKDSDEKLRKYRWESKYYDITTDLFQIQKHDLDSLRDQLDSSSNAKENVKRSIYESSEDIAELLKKMTKNVPTKEGPDESIAKISKSKNDQLKDKIPSGTKWADIEITFIDNEYVRIKVKGKVIDPSVHYSQMGFKHKTSPIRIKSWSALKAFALGNGIIPPKYGSDGKLIKTVSIDDIKGLKSKLCDCFGITGSPIPRYDKGKKYNKSEGYKTLFSINEASGLINSISNYHDSD